MSITKLSEQAQARLAQATKPERKDATVEKFVTSYRYVTTQELRDGLQAEAVNNDKLAKLRTLSNSGFVGDKNRGKFLAIMRKMELNQKLTPAENTFVTTIYNKLSNMFTTDPQLYNRLKYNVVHSEQVDAYIKEHLGEMANREELAKKMALIRDAHRLGMHHYRNGVYKNPYDKTTNKMLHDVYRLGQREAGSTIKVAAEETEE